MPADFCEMWNEVNFSHTIGAYTGSVLMCRKIGFTTAANYGLPRKNEKGWAPQFEKCAVFLVDEGSSRQTSNKKRADSIRIWGNAATRKLESIKESTLAKAIEFTEMIRIHRVRV